MSMLIDYSPEEDAYVCGGKDLDGPVPRGFRLSGRAHPGRLEAPAWFPLGHRAVLAAAESHGKGARLTKAAHDKYVEGKARLEAIKGLKLTTEHGDLFPVPPYAHQLEAVELLQHCDKMALLLEQGMGKTFISLMSLLLLKRRGLPCRALAVCPKIVLPGWISECSKYAPSLKILPYGGSSAERAELRGRIVEEDPDLVLATYDTLTAGKGGRPSAEALASAWEGLDGGRRADTAAGMEGLGLITGESRDYLVTVPDSPRRVKGWAKRCGAMLSKVDAVKSRLPEGSVPDDEDDAAWLFTGRWTPDVLIADEASRIVNPTSARSKAVAKIARKAKRVWLLSGTLCVGKPTDLFGPLDAMDRGIFNMNWWQFRKRYCVMSSFNEHAVVGYRNLDQLKERADPFIHEGKREDALDLPDRTVVTRSYDLSPAEKRLYNSIVSEESVEVDGDTVHCAMSIQKILKCRQVLSGFVMSGGPGCCSACAGCPPERVLECVAAGVRPGDARCRKEGAEPDPEVLHEVGTSKLSALKEVLGDVLPKEKAIIWAYFRHDLKKIGETLEGMGVPYVTPETPGCVEAFEGLSEGAFLGQVAQGIGITLNSATTTVYYSHGMALEPRLQSMDRNYRIGQTKKVLVVDMVCPGSVEALVVDLLEHKRDVKDFMQTGVRCFDCGSFESCLERGVRCMQPGCRHYGARVEAEGRRTLRLRPIA